MEANNEELPEHLEVCKSDLMVGAESMNEQSRNIEVKSLEEQSRDDFCQEPLSSSPLLYHQAPRDHDVGLLSAITKQHGIGTIHCSGNLTFSSMDYENTSSGFCSPLIGNNLGLTTYHVNKRLKKSSGHTHTMVHCHNRRDALGQETYPASMYVTSSEQQLRGESFTTPQSDSLVTIAIHGSREPCSSNAVGSRLRRAKITDAIKALEESTPHMGKGTRESVLDDVIDYIKYLKLQITALSQRRLGGEPVYHPFVHLEGFGHYLLHQQVPYEPLEEVVGHLMDSNMPLATHLLESKGLELLPISSSHAIVKASADELS